MLDRLLDDGSRASAPTGSAAATAAVVASFYPVQWLAERVGGECVEVTSLTRQGPSRTT